LDISIKGLIYGLFSSKK